MYNHIAVRLFLLIFMLSLSLSSVVGYLGDQDYVEFYEAHVDT